MFKNDPETTTVSTEESSLASQIAEETNSSTKNEFFHLLFKNCKSPICSKKNRRNKKSSDYIFKKLKFAKLIP